MADNVVRIQRAWTPLADASWRNIESIFEVQQQLQQSQQQKTPPRRVCEPTLPAAPRKPLQQALIRREGLKPRRLTYDLSSPDSGIDADKENQPPRAAPIPQSSSGKSRVKRRQVKDIKDQKTKPASELRLRLRI